MSEKFTLTSATSFELNQSGSTDWFVRDEKGEVVHKAFTKPDAIRWVVTEARVKTLEKALRPFAAHDRALGKSYGPFRLYDETGYREMPREELRAASAALQPAAEIALESVTDVTEGSGCVFTDLGVRPPAYPKYYPEILTDIKRRGEAGEVLSVDEINFLIRLAHRTLGIGE